MKQNIKFEIAKRLAKINNDSFQDSIFTLTQLLAQDNDDIFKIPEALLNAYEYVCNEQEKNNYISSFKKTLSVFKNELENLNSNEKDNKFVIDVISGVKSDVLYVNTTPFDSYSNRPVSTYYKAKSLFFFDDYSIKEIQKCFYEHKNIKSKFMQDIYGSDNISIRKKIKRRRMIENQEEELNRKANLIVRRFMLLEKSR